jgi:hypothetical protein
MHFPAPDFDQPGISNDTVKYRQAIPAGIFIRKYRNSGKGI